MTESATFTFRAIGHIENTFTELAAPDLIRATTSRIVLDEAFVPGLQGIEPGQQLIVIFVFHRSRGYELQQHPRGDRARPRRGVFALHSPNRPNPIGVTVVDLLDITGNVLQVRGLDALDGTPLLDLKPA
jgi:tRNA-Thr(GGU) m(6)t(6)A37 methyltransferase TsaA